MTSFQKVTAIIRMKKLTDVERELVKHGVDGITVTLVKGFGEWHPDRHFGYTKILDRLTVHARIEVFVETDKADAVVEVIAKAACTGHAGDGVIAMLPVTQFVHIRSYAEQVDEAPEDDDPEERSSP
ncbi:hypothetical protein MNBD_PLANCTO03-674 [hydrothermal vent metagenome]|uniref:Nitrogen regulatory protein P-II n=1 Tax=hydrothermal vent metagenome TaxID=652676 RepID=A0A3B1DAL3_9ZZZZ